MEMHMYTSTVGVALLPVVAAANAALAESVASAKASQEVLAREDDRFAAMIAADTAALAGMLADDLLYVHSSARVETKQQYLDAIATRSIRYLAFVPAERRVTFIDGGAAVTMGRANAKVILGGQTLDFDVRYIAVYSRAGDRWQLRAWQTTRIPPSSGG
jgi:ketosteroid isomerase-like protein